VIANAAMIATLLIIRITNMKASKMLLLAIILNFKFLLKNFLKLSQISESGMEGRCHFGFCSNMSISSKNSFREMELVSLVSIYR